jgi:DNA excision repair protein ERCC-4
MMETLFLSNWQHEKNGERLSNPAKMRGFQGGDEVKLKQGELESKTAGGGRGKGTPYYKRRRIRGGGSMQIGKRGKDDDM